MSYSFMLRSKNPLDSCFLFNAHLVFVNESVFSVKPHFKKDGTLILAKSHTHLNTFLDLKGIAPYALLLFDNNHQFMSATYSLNRNGAPFALQTQAYYIVFMSYPCNINLETLTHLQIENPCYQ